MTAIFVLVSNNNYLFDAPLSEEELSEGKKRRAGLAAREWLQEAAESISILYVHPRGSGWIAGPVQ